MSNNGIVIGIVDSLEDPDDLGRVCVRFPHLQHQLSNWAPVASLMAGKERGAFFRPEVKDRVLLGFEHGDVNRPFVLGGLWSTKDKPPADDGKKVENNWRFLRSRSGHLFKFDDTPGAETIEIESGKAKHRIVIDDAGKKVRIESDNGDIEVTSKTGTVTIKATTLKVEATDIEVKAQSSLKMEAPQVDIKASAQAVVESSGPLTLKGALVKIN